MFGLKFKINEEKNYYFTFCNADCIVYLRPYRYLFEIHYRPQLN